MEMSEPQIREEILQMLLKVSREEISRNEAAVWAEEFILKVIPENEIPVERSLQLLGRLSWAHLAILAAEVNEKDFYATGAPYFFRNEDFKELAEIVLEKDAPRDNSLKMHYIRPHQIKKEFRPFLYVSKSIEDIVKLYDLPHVRGIEDGLGYSKDTICEDNLGNQYLISQYMQSLFGTQISVPFEEFSQEAVERVIETFKIEQNEIVWITENF